MTEPYIRQFVAFFSNSSIEIIKKLYKFVIEIINKLYKFVICFAYLNVLKTVGTLQFWDEKFSTCVARRFNQPMNFGTNKEFVQSTVQINFVHMSLQIVQ